MLTVKEKKENIMSWTKEEVESVLGKEAPLFLDYFNITSPGNWEKDKNILFRKLTDDEILKKYNIAVAGTSK